MSYNVTVSGTDYEGIDKVELPITGENTKATFYAGGIEELLMGNITSFESDTAFSDNSNTLRAYGFYSSKSLQSVSLPNAVYLPASFFESCIALASVSIPMVDSVSASVFATCTALEKIAIPSVKGINAKAFNNCTGLKKVDSSVVTSIAATAFNNCSALEALILRNTTIATLANTNAFLGSSIASGTGYIYVPSALVDSYKSATNWSTYASQFRAIEDYTVDGTTTGELDETKI